MEVNEQELVEFIFDRLVEKGIIVNRDDILTILDLEMEYMVKEGFAVVVKEDE
ncbi:hypothetical protein MKZ15_05745 [Paenibacillus sp. FSL R7-0216]|uniref:hypothetical protein n=1 Tax=Paenibacillus sp. FSL R7-0216 TaxID=2921677 RepID=UPI0030D85368